MSGAQDITSQFLNVLGHFHPALVHFPVALLLTGSAVEAWSSFRGRSTRSSAGRLLLMFGTAGALLAVASGLSLFHPADFRDRTLEVARIHRLLGLLTGSVAVASLIAGGFGSPGPTGMRLHSYRLFYFLAGILAALTGHYGGWVVFGWGRVWTF